MENFLRLRSSLSTWSLMVICLPLAILQSNDVYAAPMKLLSTAEAAVHEEAVSELQCIIKENGEHIEVVIVNAGHEGLSINAIFLGLDAALETVDGSLPNLNIAQDNDLRFSLDDKLPQLPEAAITEPNILYQATMENGCPKRTLHPGEELRIQFVIADLPEGAPGIPKEKLIFGLQASPDADNAATNATWYVAESA